MFKLQLRRKKIFFVTNQKKNMCKIKYQMEAIERRALSVP